MRITRTLILSTRYQSAEITSHGGDDQVGFLRVYKRGVQPVEISSHLLGNSEPVRVSGRPGRFAVPDFGAVLVWKYAPKSYATVDVPFHLKPHETPLNSHSAAAVRDRRIALRIARATKIGPAEPIGIDFTLGYLPAGLRYNAVEYESGPDPGRRPGSPEHLGRRKRRAAALNRSGGHPVFSVVTRRQLVPRPIRCARPAPDSSSAHLPRPARHHQLR
jgi:hypothetical protein